MITINKESVDVWLEKFPKDLLPEAQSILSGVIANSPPIKGATPDDFTAITSDGGLCAAAFQINSEEVLHASNYGIALLTGEVMPKVALLQMQGDPDGELDQKWESAKAKYAELTGTEDLLQHFLWVCEEKDLYLFAKEQRLDGEILYTGYITANDDVISFLFAHEMSDSLFPSN